MCSTSLLSKLRLSFLATSVVGTACPVVAQFFQPEITDAILASRTIDVDLPVGVIAGEAGVSTAGGATWSMAFVVPPGTNGVQPSVGIAYNSQGGDGPLGWGWNITGLSAITRTGSDWYRDVDPNPDPQFNGVVGVTFTSADRFALDGQRLVLLTGSAYGAAGSTYDTEDASFSLVTAVGSGPDHFTVVTKSGMYMEFGATADSRVIGNNTSGVFSWRLNRMRDPNGNYIDYVYDYVDGENRLRRIDYTGNATAGILPYNRILFDYEPRPDKNELFIHGLNGPKTASLLASVTITCEGEHMKTYRFNYSDRDIAKSYLREITEWGVGEVHQLNSTVFKYGDPITSVEPPESFFSFLGQGHDYYSGDYDGDGDSELLASPISYTEDGFKYNEALKVYRRDAPGNLTETWSLELESNIQLVNGQNSPQTYTANVSNDMNGDGRDDIVLCKVEWDGGYYRFRNLQVHESTSNDASMFTASPEYGPPGEHDIVYPSTFNYQISGDFNGDGRGDMILFLSNGNGFGAFMYSPSAGIAAWPVSFFVTDPPAPSNFAGNICMNERLIPIDFDGDGQHEIMTVPGPNSVDQVTRIYKFWNNPFYGSNYPYPAFWKVYESSTFPTQGHELFPGDFNGDGKTDLLNRYGQYGEWSVSYSNGMNFGWGPEFDQFNTYVELPEDPGEAQIDILNVADFNGDGRSDICHGHAEGGNTQIDIFYSRGSLQDFEERTYMYSGLFGMAPRMITDMNGDGRSELVNTANIFDPLQVFFFGKAGHERSLHKVANGMNAINEFEYDYATQNGEVLNPNSFTYPKGMVKLPIEVVHRLYSPDGLGSGGTTFTEYAWSGATVNRTAGGFLGFQLRAVADPYMNAGTITLSIPHPTYAKLLPWKEERRELAGQLLLNHTDLTYACVPLLPSNARRHFTELMTSTTYDDLAGTWTAVVNEWDVTNYGNIVSSTTNNYGIESVTTLNEDWVAVGSSPYPSLPRLVTVRRTRAGHVEVEKRTRFGYDAPTGHVNWSREYADTDGNVLTQFSYNNTGTLRTRSVSALSVSPSEWPSEEFHYDTKHRFVRESIRKWWTGGGFTDVTTVTETDPKWGRPLAITMPDGMTTAFRYDAFGRLEQTDAPHPTGAPVPYTVTEARAWALDGLEYYYTSSLSSEDESGVDVIGVYHDLLGRPVRTVTEGFNHQEVHAAKGYDMRGNVAWETTPHFQGEDFITTTNQYDPLNRLSETSNTLTATSTYDYTYGGGQLTVTVDAPSGVRSTTTDAAGRTVKATDHGGQLRYDYDSNGNLLTVHHGSDLVAENTYDAYGRQTSLWAPGAGNTEYRYNAIGNLSWQKDANANEVTLEYDNLGRLTRRYAPEGNTQYAYYNLNGHINDNPMVVTGPGVTRSFVYDSHFRLQQATSIINGVTYITSYQNNDFGQVTSTTYPSGLLVSDEYDNTGALYRRYWSGGTLYRVLARNGLGQDLEYELADGRTVTREYDHGFLERIHAGDVQDLHMAYDFNTGNMDYRWDAMQLLKESFGYDELNRLTDARLNTTDFGGGIIGNDISYYDYGYDGAINDHTRGGLILRSDIGQLPHDNRVSAAKHINYPQPYNQPPAVISQATQKITYTPFLKTATINELVGGDNYHLTYEYGPEQQRVRSVLTKNNTDPAERIYLGEYEKQIQNSITQEMHYIAGGSGLASIIVRTGNVWQAYAAYTDHLGSPVVLTSAANGTIVAEQNFDPWGRRRNPDTWTYDNIPAVPSWLYRGFTGHEHADPFSLINMNGRMYDPNTGRMMSADGFVASSSSTQAYNRYAYANSNPLVYTDPTGQIAWFVPILIGAAVGFEIGGAWADDWTHWSPTDWDQESWQAAGIGAIAGAGIGAGISAFAGLSGTGFQAGLVANASAKASFGWSMASNALITGNINMLSMWAQGGTYKDVVISGGIGVASGAIGGAVGDLVDKGSKAGWSLGAVRAQLYTTNMLNGFGDRFYRATVAGNDNPWLVGLAGALEGALVTDKAINARIGLPSHGRTFLYDGSRKLSSGVLDYTRAHFTDFAHKTVTGRFLPMIYTTAVTSIPRASALVGIRQIGPSAMALALNPAQQTLWQMLNIGAWAIPPQQYWLWDLLDYPGAGRP